MACNTPPPTLPGVTAPKKRPRFWWLDSGGQIPHFFNQKEGVFDAIFSKKEIYFLKKIYHKIYRKNVDEMSMLNDVDI